MKAAINPERFDIKVFNKNFSVRILAYEYIWRSGNSETTLRVDVQGDKYSGVYMYNFYASPGSGLGSVYKGEKKIYYPYDRKQSAEASEVHEICRSICEGINFRKKPFTL